MNDAIWHERIISKARRGEIPCMVLLLFLIGLFANSFFYPYKNLTKSVSFPEIDGYSAPLYNGIVLQQPMKLHHDTTQIYFRIATFCQVLTQGKLEAKLVEQDSKEILAEMTWSADQLLDNSTLEFPVMVENTGSYTLELQVSEQSEESLPLVIWTSQISDIAQPCIIGDETQTYMIASSISTAASNTKYVIPTLAIVGFTFLLILAMCVQYKTAVSAALVGVIIVLLSCLANYYHTVSAEVKNLAYGVTLFLIWVVVPILAAKIYGEQLYKELQKHLSGMRCILLLSVFSLGVGALVEFGFTLVFAVAWLWIRFLFWTALAVIGSVLIMFRKSILQCPEKIFLLVSLSLGLYMTIFLPIRCISWDEQIHYHNAVILSQSHNAVLTGADNAVINMQIQEEFSTDKVENTLQSLEELHISKSYLEETEGCFFPNRFAYLPSVLGLWLGKVLCVPFYMRFIAGRIGNMLFYSIIMFFAIKRLKGGKVVLSIIALFPTNLLLASVYSYDAWLTALMALGFAMFIGSLQRSSQKLTFGECAVMLGALILSILPKGVYGIAILILLLMPKNKFASQRQMVWFRVAVWLAFIFALCMVFSSVISWGGVTDLRGGEGVDATGQIKYILTHPFSYLETLLKFLYSYLSPEHAAGYISDWAYLRGTGACVVPLTCLTFAVFTDHQESNFMYQRPQTRLAILAILFATISAVASALYVSFNPVANTTVNGCQYRYITPLLFPFCILFFSSKYQFSVNRERYNLIFILISTFEVAASIWTGFVKWMY